MKKREFKNILVVSLSNIGDVVLSLPVVAVLKGNFPNADISINIGPKAEPLLAGNRFFKDVVLYDKHASAIEKLRFAWRLFRGKYDLVIDLRNTIIPFLCCARAYNSPFKRLKQWDGSMRDKHVHALDFLGLDRAKKVKVPLYADTHALSAVEICKRAGSGFSPQGTVVVIAPGARTFFKAWPPEHYAALCRLLLKNHPAVWIVLTGSDAEKEVCHAVWKRACSDRVVNVAGRLSIPEFASLADIADVVIANDSAAMHIASYQERPTVAIFGPTDAVKYGPRGMCMTVVKSDELSCVPCMGVSCEKDRACLTKLTPERVFAAVEKTIRL